MGFLLRFNSKTGAMDIRRTVLWMIFSLSLLLLWNNWQVHNGKPSLFGGSSTATQTAEAPQADAAAVADPSRSEEHTSELQSLMRISYAVFCLKKKQTQTNTT